MSLFAWIETTAIARAVGGSLPLTAWLSAVHALGFTLTMGSAFLLNLRLLNAVLPQHIVSEVARPTSYAILLGLAVSLLSGGLLFSTRASSAIENNTFQIKMLLLISAVVFHFLIQARVTRQLQPGMLVMRTSAVFGLALWAGLAVAACWFILFE